LILNINRQTGRQADRLFKMYRTDDLICQHQKLEEVERRRKILTMHFESLAAIAFLFFCRSFEKGI